MSVVTRAIAMTQAKSGFRSFYDAFYDAFEVID
jgi:hypothetical protein